MQKKQMQILGALRAGQRSLDANASALAEINLGEAREALDASVERLARLAAEQDATRMRTVGERSREQRLAIAFHRTHLGPIVAMARLQRTGDPQLSSVRLPKQGRNSTQLIELGRAIADMVQPYEAQFVRMGLRVGFVDRLRAAADQLVASTVNKEAQRSLRRGATESLSTETLTARRLIARFDAIFRAEPAVPERVVTEWHAAVRTLEGGLGRLVTPEPQPLPSGPEVIANAA